ncbi:MAG: hypothetical protein ACKO96_16480, partial [Flammeovirgaceae bacterium]
PQNPKTPHSLRLDLNKMSQLLTGAQIEAANIATQNEIQRRLALRAFQERNGETLYDFAQEYDFKKAAADRE